MLDGRTIAVVVPAYDEAQLIGRTLQSIPRYVDVVVVVDDGSSDGTTHAATSTSRNVELIEHRQNLGVGAAISTGCGHAFAIGADLVVVMAADGQMATQDLPTMLKPLLAHEADFVKGSRLDWPGAPRAMPCHRWIGNHALSLLTRLALRSNTRDSQCGYLALNRVALGAIPWRALWRGYGYPNDLLGRAMSLGLRIEEVPVRPVYGEETSGIRLWHALAVIPFVIARACLRRLSRGAIEAPWPTSTSSTAMQTASARSLSSATRNRERAR
jgi:glycosyltransferase involved in cell wall biosynthesis